jgi:hypothetical protein
MLYTQIRAAIRTKTSVGCVLSLGSRPAAPGEVWWAEIAVLPPGEHAHDLDGWASLRSTVKIDGVRSMSAAVVVLLAAVLLILRCMSSPTPAVPGGTPQELEGLILPSACGVADWTNVMHTCSDEVDWFYGDNAPGNWLFQAVTSPMTELNLGHVGSRWQVTKSHSSWGQKRGDVCSHPQTRCARALRGYLDYCPLDPVVVAAATSWHNWTRDDRRAGQSSDTPCEPLRPCAGHIDLFFLRQCLGTAFPALVSPATLTLTFGGVVYTPVSDQRDSGKQLERRASLRGVQRLSSRAAVCEVASAAVFRECSAGCSTQMCTHVPGISLASPAADRTGDNERAYPSNCQYLKDLSSLGRNTTRLTEKSGCGCKCYARGTTCEAAMANALRVYAQEQTANSPGCYNSELRLHSSKDQNGTFDPDRSASLPASALLTMLFTARGVRWIPVQY